VGGATGDHVGKFADLESEERRPEHESDQSKEVVAVRLRELTASDINPHVKLEARRQAVSIATPRLTEQLNAGRASCGRADKYA